MHSFNPKYKKDLNITKTYRIRNKQFQNNESMVRFFI